MTDSTASSQLLLFNEKISVDKNLGFQTVVKDGNLVFKFDLAQSFEEEAQDVWDMIIFLTMKHSQEPLLESTFTLKEYAEFTSRTYKNIAKLSKGKKTANWTNDVERLLYKMVNRNIVLNTDYITPSGKERKVMKPFPLLINYEMESDPLDKRSKVYFVKLSHYVLVNLSTYFYYISVNDFRQLMDRYTRHPHLRILFSRLCSLLNNLKAGIHDTVSFDELAYILNYTYEPKRTKQRITENIDRLLTEMDSLKGLQFSWETNKNGYAYIPNFYINSDIHDNKINNKSKDTYKRLDILILSRLEFLTKKMNSKVIQLSSMAEIPTLLGGDIYSILSDCYKVIMGGKAMPGDFVENFVKLLCYKDDFGNLYGSMLMRYIKINRFFVYQEQFVADRKVTLLYNDFIQSFKQPLEIVPAKQK